MSKFLLSIKILAIGLIALELSGCIATAAVAGVAAGGYYEKHKND